MKRNLKIVWHVDVARLALALLVLVQHMMG